MTLEEFRKMVAFRIEETKYLFSKIKNRSEKEQALHDMFIGGQKDILELLDKHISSKNTNESGE